MFFTYLRRELRRRIRQAIFIALGLALGIGLVITVIAASSGVKDAQATVLHSLYGVGTDITVTQTPTAGSGGPTGFGFRGRVGSGTRPAAGTKIDIDNLTSIGQGTLAASSVTSIGKLHNVAGSAGALSLTDAVITGKIPAINTSGGGTAPAAASAAVAGGGGGGGFFHGNFKSSSFTVSGVNLSTGALGPLSSAKLNSGRTFASSDATSDVAVVNSDYATQKKLSVGSTITVAKTSFKVVGIASAGSDASDVFIPLARAQALASLKGKVNTIYVAADSASNISGVAKEISAMLPKATVTTSSSLASEVTGSLSSASSLANNLGKWLAIAVLVGRVPAGQPADHGRGRPAGAGVRHAQGARLAQPADRRPGDGRIDRHRHRRRRGRGRARLRRGHPGHQADVAADRVAGPDDRLSHPGRGPDLRRRRLRRRRRAAASAARAGRAASSAGRPPTRTAWRCT